jgi:MtN3 and saliva related transmembrane protein
MDYVQALGFGAAALITAANIPQAVKIVKEKSTKGISSWTYAMLLAGGLLWVAYGICRNDLPIILSNSIASVLSAIIFGFRLFSKKPGNDFES